MTFGKVIEELASRSDGAIYRPQPFGLTVSQWRNIANHNSYEVKGSEVVCTYGTPGHYKTIRCPVDDLINLGRYINDLKYIHKIAFEFFSIDNMQALSPYVPHVDITNHTSEATLAYGLTVAGFRIERIGYGDEADYGSKKWALFLFDEHNRSEIEAKTALQDAVSTYILLTGSIDVLAFVKTDTSLYEFSFKAKVGSKTEATPDNNWEARSLDEYFRPIPESKNF